MIGRNFLSYKKCPFCTANTEGAFDGLCFNYPSLIAPVGQTPAQVPQEMQASASITYWLSPWEIALTGHSLSQVPQLTQESEITYAMIISSLNIL